MAVDNGINENLLTEVEEINDNMGVRVTTSVGTGGKSRIIKVLNFFKDLYTYIDAADTDLESDIIAATVPFIQCSNDNGTSLVVSPGSFEDVVFDFTVVKNDVTNELGSLNPLVGTFSAVIGKAYEITLITEIDTVGSAQFRMFGLDATDVHITVNSATPNQKILKFIGYATGSTLKLTADVDQTTNLTSSNISIKGLNTL